MRGKESSRRRFVMHMDTNFIRLSTSADMQQQQAGTEAGIVTGFLNIGGKRYEFKFDQKTWGQLKEQFEKTEDDQVKSELEAKLCPILEKNLNEGVQFLLEKGFFTRKIGITVINGEGKSANINFDNLSKRVGAAASTAKSSLNWWRFDAKNQVKVLKSVILDSQSAASENASRNEVPDQSKGGPPLVITPSKVGLIENDVLVLRRPTMQEITNDTKRVSVQGKRRELEARGMFDRTYDRYMASTTEVAKSGKNGAQENMGMVDAAKDDHERKVRMGTRLETLHVTLEPMRKALDEKLPDFEKGEIDDKTLNGWIDANASLARAYFYETRQRNADMQDDDRAEVKVANLLGNWEIDNFRNECKSRIEISKTKNKEKVVTDKPEEAEKVKKLLNKLVERRVQGVVASNDPSKELGVTSAQGKALIEQFVLMYKTVESGYRRFKATGTEDDFYQSNLPGLRETREALDLIATTFSTELRGTVCGCLDIPANPKWEDSD